MPKPLPSAELLRKLLRYEADTGKLYWRKRSLDLFKSSGSCKTWNTKYAGKEAFTAIHWKGYAYGTVLYKVCRAHRVCWAIHHGSWPENEVDHINGVRTDNRISNLRDVSPLENRKNSKTPSNNSSGHIGVRWHAAAKKWQATIGVNKTSVYLGLYDKIDDAISARQLAERRYGFHKNHGRE